jgi:hypothetical protein
VSYCEETYATVMKGRQLTRAELTRMLLEMAATADTLQALCQEAQSIVADSNNMLAEVVDHFERKELHAVPTGSVH